MAQSGLISAVRIKDGIAFLLLLSSLSAVTSRAPISPLFVALAMLVALPALVNPATKIPRTTLWCGAFLLMASLSAIASGLSPFVFLDYSFYRYDGNAFISLLPFLLLPAIKGHRLPLRIGLELTVSSIAVVLLSSEILAPELLFNSHNALGGVISVVLLVNISLLDRRYMFYPLILNIAALHMSDSRGSAIGLIAALVTLSLVERGRKKMAAWFAGLLVVGSLLLAVVGHHVWRQIGSPEVLDIDNFSSAIETLGQSGGEGIESVSSIGSRGSTISHRVFFIWPVAVEDFLSSPMVGIGFSRFDDRPTHLEGIPGLIARNDSPNIHHSDLHAHHSFLHVAAETGLVGLSIIVAFLVSIWRASESLEPIWRRMVRYLLLYAIYSSCTEHRLFTPAQMLPAAAIMALVITYAGGDQRVRGFLADQRREPAQR